MGYLRFRKSFFPLAFLLIVISAKGQHLDISPNVIRGGDLVEKIHCHYGSVGNDGEHVVWDFSDRMGNTLQTIYYSIDSLDVLTGNDGTALYNYVLRGDSLLQTGYETPLEHITYQEPLLNMVYPVHYGDSFSGPFQGYGRYCGTHEERVSGQVSVVADAYGCLVLSENDTLNHVLRVYTLKTQSISMEPDSCRADSDSMKQEIEEHYQWYARGYRYPVYETVSRTTYDRLTPVACRQYAYCYLPESQRQLNDSVNENIEKNWEIGEHDIFHYSVHTQGKTVTVNYDLDQGAHIRFIIADIMGIVHKQGEQDQQAGSDFIMQIDCIGLPSRQYVLYMNVNGKIYSEKIIL